MPPCPARRCANMVNKTLPFVECLAVATASKPRSSDLMPGVAAARGGHGREAATAAVQRLEARIAQFEGQRTATARAGN
jgi:hypothetical protein